jgi:glucosyl-dolichyl phosphate glucuronosyltransferase
MNVTVILCTYNRWQLLAQTLENITALTLPSFISWEVLVVDNNSNDRTCEVVERFRRDFPGRFRYLFEPRAGKSHALNSGVRSSQGEVLAFIDDDVMVDPTWLHNLILRLLTTAEWSGSGGPVVLRWSQPPPKWLAQDRPYALAPLAGFCPHDQQTQLSEPPFGTNMAFRRSMFDKYGLFRTDLGPSPCGDIPRPNEDTEFGRRLIKGGERLRYEPSAVVYHPVSKDRLDKRYFQKWWYDKGRAEVREFGDSAPAMTFRGVPLYTYRRLVIWTLRWILAVTPSSRFDCWLRVCCRLGEYRESRDQLRQRRASKNEGVGSCA